MSDPEIPKDEGSFGQMKRTVPHGSLPKPPQCEPDSAGPPQPGPDASAADAAATPPVPPTQAAPQPSQRVMYDYGGGGGWGSPRDREPQAVLDDVLDEYGSGEGAERDYGVVLTGSLEDLTLEIDEEANAARRAQRRG